MIKILLLFVDATVGLFLKRDLIELSEHRLVEPFTDPVRLRTLRLGRGVIDVAERQAQLAILGVGPPADLRPAKARTPCLQRTAPR